jgi:DNA-directed RNA polymerase subunit RPC12/RpoP
LDELITDAWESLMVGKLVRCPACHGKMQTRVAALGGVEGGECADCGALLS